MSERRMTYTFGPLERRGLLGPVRAGQAALIAVSAAAAIVAIDAARTPGAALPAVALVAAALAAAFAPVGGRTLDEWGPIGVAFALRRARQRRPRSTAATDGSRWRWSGLGLTRRQAAAAGDPLAATGVRIVTIGYRGRELGALSESGGRRLTAVLACRVGAFALLDREAQERRLARWGMILAAAAGTPVRRLQWLERTVPAQGDELARWLHDERDPELPPRGTPIVESYLELISSSARVSQEHEILVALQVDAKSVRERGSEATQRALAEQTERVARGLRDAEVTVLGALGPGQLARALRTAFDPYARAELAALDAAGGGGGMDEVNAWPLGEREAWDHYRCDGALHATYWIGAWPRTGVSPMFMDSLLGQAVAVRTVAVTFEPLAPDRSTREVEAAVTRDRADRELRARFGQSETARQRQAAEATARREAELAAGHAEVRLSGFVTVSGRDEDDLRRACAEVNDHAARARLELHRLYGQQAQAFVFTLPLCRGLR
ncbi:MAG: SCO6880 family protein [Solirubrobacteraceae bacterium]